MTDKPMTEDEAVEILREQLLDLQLYLSLPLEMRTIENAPRVAARAEEAKLLLLLSLVEDRVLRG